MQVLIAIALTLIGLPVVYIVIVEAHELHQYWGH